LLKSVWKCELLEFDCLCRLAMRGLHYGQELVPTNRSDTFAQTTTHDNDSACNPAADHTISMACFARRPRSISYAT
jgi:hypothetical protein